MPYIISVTRGKEKLVKANLAKRPSHALSIFDLLDIGLNDFHTKHMQVVDCSIPPFRGFLVSEATSLPQEILNMPYIHGVTEATVEQVRGLMHAVSKQIIKEGMMVQMVRGEYIGVSGIVRTIVGNDALVDLSIYGKMVAVHVPVNDVKRISHED